MSVLIRVTDEEPSIGQARVYQALGEGTHLPDDKVILSRASSVDLCIEPFAPGRFQPSSRYVRQGGIGPERHAPHGGGRLGRRASKGRGVRCGLPPLRPKDYELRHVISVGYDQTAFIPSRERLFHRVLV